MNFKEFDCDNDIRICVYHVGDENLPYHRHTHLSDITYCISGQLMLELPEIDAATLFEVGQFVQVPMNMIHRVSHRSHRTNQSSYVLVQIGRFSIDFMDEIPAVAAVNYRHLSAATFACFVGSAADQLALIAKRFVDKRPPNLTDAEHDGILVALDGICRNGITGVPNKEATLTALRDASYQPVELLG